MRGLSKTRRRGEVRQGPPVVVRMPEAFQSAAMAPSARPAMTSAAAARIAARFFQRSLREVCGIYRDEPEYFEYLLMSATHLLEGDA